MVHCLTPFLSKNRKRTTNRIMLFVILACIPGIMLQSYFFGYGNLIQMFIAITVALTTEAFVLWLRKRPIINTLSDNSAMLTALLLAISIPAYAPWWIIVIGSLFAILIAKQLYGGLGQNLFNPAMVGYVVLLISFPQIMTHWPMPLPLNATHPSFIDCWKIIWQMPISNHASLSTLLNNIDGVSQATPLDRLKTELTYGNTVAHIFPSAWVSLITGNAWLWINIGFLFGGLGLWLCRVIQWQLPFAFLLTLGLLTLIQHWLVPATTISLTWQLFSGSTMLAAFFIITDPVTAPVTTKGRLLYGTIIGFLVWLIRSYGGYPEGIAFAILLANIMVPLIDHVLQPKVYGDY